MGLLAQFQLTRESSGKLNCFELNDSAIGHQVGGLLIERTPQQYLCPQLGEVYERIKELDAQSLLFLS